MRKRFITLLLTAALTGSMYMTSFAYQSWDPSEAGKNWRWEDWKDEGVYECYYYKDNGYRGYALYNTPDGYTLDNAGAWTIDGVVQTRFREKVRSISEVNTNIEYNPKHPLARMIDSWELELVDTNFETGTMPTLDPIVDWNVHAMLTGQMEKYREPFNEEQKAEEQILYNWFCEWLNSFDFEHMTEMERAQKIEQTLITRSYDYDYANSIKDARNPYYAVLINKKGVCSEYAFTATSLAKSLGLKSIYRTNIGHAWYYIRVDGVGYSGENGVLILDRPSIDIQSGEFYPSW